MTNRILIAVIILVLAVVGYSLWQHHLQNQQAIELNTMSVEKVSPSSTPIHSAMPILSPAKATTNSAVASTDYSYLFINSQDNKYSNIVGYFARGAFSWYVPDWLPNNWTLKNVGEGFDISPQTPKDHPDFSDILLTVSTSTEVTNASTFYDRDVKNTPAANLLESEVVLNNNPPNAMLKLIIEPDTRIYHTRMKANGIVIDNYYMDAYGKTLDVYFAAKAEVYDQFDDNIRNFVEGIGASKPQQG